MSNKTQLNINNTQLQQVLDTIKSLPSKNSWGGGTVIRPTTTNQIIPAYTDKELTVEGSANLKASNIKKGIDIFGVIGTMEQGKVGIDFGTVTPSSDEYSITVKHTLGKVPSKIVIAGMTTKSLSHSEKICYGNESKGIRSGGYNNEASISSFEGKKTNEEIEFKYSYSTVFESGVEYRWFAIA